MKHNEKLTLITVFILLNIFKAEKFNLPEEIVNIVISYVVIFVCRRMELINITKFRILRVNINYIKYMLWLILQIIKSSLQVTKIIWSRSIRINPYTRWVHSNLKSDSLISILAYSITITPGTCTVIINQDRLLINSLWRREIDNIEESELFQKVSIL